MTDERIDLCLAAPLFYPAFTGAGIRFQRYAPGLQRRGIDMRVFAGSLERLEALSSPSGRIHQGGEFPPPEAVNGIPVHRVNLHGTSTFCRDIEYAQALLNYCRHPETRPDIVHFLSVSPFWLLKYYHFRRLNIPIVHSHTLLTQASSSPLKRTLQHFLWKAPLQIADCVITNNDVALDMLKGIGVTRRIEVIPNGVDLQRFRPAISESAKWELRRSLGLNGDSEIILYVGSLTERKGVDILVAAWAEIAARFPRARLLLVGPMGKDMGQRNYSPDFQSRIEREIAKSRGGARVLLIGKVDNVEDYYRASDVFVFPSRREGMPNAVLEAMACAIPCVLTPFLGLSDAFGCPGEQYILAERTPDAIAQAVMALLEDSERRVQLGQQARRWVETHMDLEKSLDHYASLYRELVHVCNR